MTEPTIPDEEAAAQLVVTYNDHQTMYYPTGTGRGWRIDAASRCIVVGKFPRTYIPLDQVLSFDIEPVTASNEDVNLSLRRRLLPVAVNGCDGCSVEPGETHRYSNCPGALRAEPLEVSRG